MPVPHVLGPDVPRSRSGGRASVWLLALLALGLLAGALLLFDGAAPAPPGSTSETSAAAAPAVPSTLHADAATTGEPDDADPGPPTTTPTQAARAAVSNPPAADPLVTGRCVDERGQPLRGATVAVEAVRPLGAPTPPPQACAPDGRFALRLPAHVVYELRMRAPQRGTVVTSTGNLQPGAQLALGDVVLREGRTVTATVVDEEGVPQPHLLVDLRRDPRGIFRAPVRPLRSIGARSDTAGGVQLAEPILPGKWKVFVHGRRQRSDSVLEIPPGPGGFAFEVRIESVDPTRRIHGQVIDQAGQPVAGATVLARLPEPAEDAGDPAPRPRSERFVNARSADDGGFVLQRPEPSPDGRVQLRVQAAGCEQVDDTATASWGSDVVLRVVRGAALTVHVTDTRGQPVERFTLHVFEPLRPAFRELAARSRGRHAGGIARALGVPAGPHVVLVRPENTSLVQDGVLQLQTSGGSQSCRVALAPRVERRLAVLDAAGERLAGARVEMLVPLSNRPLHERTPGVELMDLYAQRGHHAALRHDLVFTNPRGFAALAGHPRTRYGLRITAHGHVPELTYVELGATVEPWEIRLRPGARVAGRLLPAEIVGWLREATRIEHGFGGAPRERLRLARRERTPPALQLTLVRERDGVREEHAPSPHGGGSDAFLFEHVPPGSWDVELAWRWLATGGGRRGFERHTLAHVAHLNDGETRTLALALDELPIALLEGGVLRRGQPFASDFLIAPAEESDSILAGERWHTSPDAEGRFRIALPPGAYRCLVRVAVSRAETVAVPSDDIATLPPGKHVTALFQIRDVEVRLAVVDEAGRPAANRTLRLWCVDGTPHGIECTTDDDGRVVTRVPAGRYRVTAVSALADDAPAALGEVVVPADGQVEETVLRLPRSKRR